MKEKTSTYQCPVCGKILQDKAGKYVRCADCGKDMAEVNKGIITK
jgi:DNA-directed RNA polymerase subunit RPC12/RpoP